MENTAIREIVLKAVADARVTDIHTHLYAPEFGPLLLWGVDEVLTYHYLIAETMRWVDMPYEKFWSLSKREQADLIWKTLFIDHVPYSEACRGALTVLQKLGMDLSTRNLDGYRAYFERQKTEDFVDKVFEVAGVETTVMTNDPFDEAEREVWLSGREIDPRFRAALRIDPLLLSWESSCPTLREWGYGVDESFGGKTYSEVRRYLGDWVDKMDALYMAVSMTPKFAFPDDSACGRLIAECVLPVCAEKNIPFALMIGVKRQVNPQLKSAGDSVGTSSLEAVDYLCANYPDNKFMVTMLARENQHELCVTARKFRNLMVFGCWWFLNNPSLIEEITRMRLELLGGSVIPQHSDARVLDQLIYKWVHSRQVIGEVLVDKYTDLAATGWRVSEEEIRRDVAGLFGQNFWRFIGR